MSSFMRAVTAQAVADPTKVEREVRRQEKERQQKHIEHNEKRKLTKAQRVEKFKAKMERDAKKETWTAVFKVHTLTDPKHKFKVDMNAQQLYLNGCLISTDNLSAQGGMHFPNLVVVEGGRVAVRKYKRLLLRRIKWVKKEGSDSEEDSEDESQKKLDLVSTERCALIWEGPLMEGFFDKWKVVEIENEHEALRTLNERGCEHYWSNMLSHKIE